MPRDSEPTHSPICDGQCNADSRQIRTLCGLGIPSDSQPQDQLAKCADSWSPLGNMKYWTARKLFGRKTKLGMAWGNGSSLGTDVQIRDSEQRTSIGLVRAVRSYVQCSQCRNCLNICESDDGKREISATLKMM